MAVISGLLLQLDPQTRLVVTRLGWLVASTGRGRSVGHLSLWSNQPERAIRELVVPVVEGDLLVTTVCGHTSPPS